MAKSSKATFGSRIIAAAREAVAVERGELQPARVTRYAVGRAEVEPPPHYDAERIREIRDQMELSQPVFAAALNVSPETIRAWEQGKRAPDGPTLRLLEVAEHHPEVFLKKVHARPSSSRRRVRTG
jgi:putative transcriptional regulator